MSISQRLLHALLLASVSSPLLAAGEVGTQVCPDGDHGVARVEVSVRVDPPGITLDRESVTVWLEPEEDQPRRVCWVVDGIPEGYTFHFERKHGTTDELFPVLIRKLTSARTFANSGNPRRVGTWRYGLRIRDAEGTSLHLFDPEVIVKGRGGG